MALNSDSYTNRDEKSGLFIALVWLPALSVFCFVLERLNPFSQSFVVLPAGIDKMVAQRTCAAAGSSGGQFTIYRGSMPLQE